jgi:DeoD family purine-nucleoside phosphorylase
MAAPIGLQPTAPLAERVLLPGDPGRALLLAQALLTDVKMFNHHRGLWGYTGTAADGAPLTVQSTGMGGPSAALVISELAELGARRLLRAGTCGALDPALALGSLVIAAEALSADGTSRALGAAETVAGDPQLVRALQDAGEARTGMVATTDLFYDDREGLEEAWAAAGAIAVEMETAALYALAAKRGFQAACLLIVSDVLFPTRVRIGEAELREAEQRMGEVAVRALGAEAAVASERGY